MKHPKKQNAQRQPKSFNYVRAFYMNQKEVKTPSEARELAAKWMAKNLPDHTE